MNINGVVLPEAFTLREREQRLQARKTDKKPWPATMRFESGYSAAFDPADVTAGTAELMSPFTREFSHPHRPLCICFGIGKRALLRRWPPLSSSRLRGAVAAVAW